MSPSVSSFEIPIESTTLDCTIRKVPSCLQREKENSIHEAASRAFVASQALYNFMRLSSRSLAITLSCVAFRASCIFSSEGTSAEENSARVSKANSVRSLSAARFPVRRLRASSSRFSAHRSQPTTSRSPLLRRCPWGHPCH